MAKRCNRVNKPKKKNIRVHKTENAIPLYHTPGHGWATSSGHCSDRYWRRRGRHKVDLRCLRFLMDTTRKQECDVISKGRHPLPSTPPIPLKIFPGTQNSAQEFILSPFHPISSPSSLFIPTPCQSLLHCTPRSRPTTRASSRSPTSTPSTMSSPATPRASP